MSGRMVDAEKLVSNLCALNSLHLFDAGFAVRRRVRERQGASRE
ncbi:hypothetical protein SAMN05216266_1032 [Amycolatopsis marina]|uniref:Uncharacterized protein n=1 Tax=Amycolatopsis marina TaxID=490629 RepID=A0A1I0X9Z9_9PSEU|nr:hypothetical protein SAMN05216266_1032 [Amycolatopsis marina]